MCLHTHIYKTIHTFIIHDEAERAADDSLSKPSPPGPVATWSEAGYWADEAVDACGRIMGGTKASEERIGSSRSASTARFSRRSLSELQISFRRRKSRSDMEKRNIDEENVSEYVALIHRRAHRFIEHAIGAIGIYDCFSLFTWLRECSLPICPRLLCKARSTLLTCRAMVPSTARRTAAFLVSNRIGR